ncbi:MAG TPA: hypothetical protein VGL77_07180, partial [Armatimonadota bacterium]
MKYRKFLPLAVSLVVLLALGIIFVRVSLRNNDGHWVYGLDDAYIHMAMAKNFTTHGVWGVTRYAYTAASSSPLWTSLLAAGYAVTGPREMASLYWNFLFALLVVVAAWAFLVAQGASGRLQLLLLLGIVTVAGVQLASFGMEHLLHILLMLLFLALVIPDLAADGPTPRSRLYWLALVTPLVVLARFESLGFIAVTIVLYACRKRWLPALLLVVMSILPVVVTGLISLAHGAFFLPNSILIKTALRGDPASRYEFLPFIVGHAMGFLLYSPLLAVMLASALFFFVAQRVRREPFWVGRSLLLLLFIFVTVGHIVSAQVGPLYRYEVYLIILGILALGLNLAVELRRQAAPKETDPVEIAPIQESSVPPDKPEEEIAYYRLAVLTLTCVLGILLTIRIIQTYTGALRATSNIYQQQYQMARFLREYYPHAPVIANDIGAISYFTDIHLLDLYGLGTLDMAKMVLAHKPFPAIFTDYLPIRQSRIAVIYDSWYSPSLHPSWVLVGQWKLEHNV